MGRAGGAVVLLLAVSVAMASDEPARGASKAGISYAGGQLRIEVQSTTLAAVLTQVARLTGVSIELPEGAAEEQLGVVDLGPGPAREVLAALLSDSHFDYLLLASDADAGRLQNVLLTPRGKKGDAAGAANNALARSNPRVFPRGAGSSPEPTQVAETPAVAPAVAPPESAPADPNPASPPNAAAQPEAVAPTSTRPVPPPTQTWPGAMAPPANPTAENMSQQLQQMYQQRAQMNQAANAATAASPGVK
jgi:hypothetical protein